MTTLAQRFTNEWRPLVEPVAKRFGINPDYMLTQIAQESYWGTKSPGGYNYAGITQPNKKAKGIWANDAGNRRKFAVYKNRDDFLNKYASLLKRRYPGTVGAKSIDEFASALQDGKWRYAEAKGYKGFLADVYNTHYSNGKTQATSSTGGSTTSEATKSNGEAETSEQSTGSPGSVGYLKAIVNEGFAPKFEKIEQEKYVDPYADLWKIKETKPEFTQPSSNVSIGTYKSNYRPTTFEYKQWGV